MKSSFPAYLIGSWLFALLATSCISVERHIEFSDHGRAQVSFENKEAARTFFSTHRRIKPYYSEQTIQTFFGIGWRVNWTLHETEWYNHMVRRTDIDGDGVITEAEVRAMIQNLDEEEADG